MTRTLFVVIVIAATTLLARDRAGPALAGQMLADALGSAFVYAYVLEGTVRSQLAGEPVRTYHQGQNWVEQPGSHHLLTENTSPTKPAKLLVIFISDTGAKLKINDQPK